MRRVAMPLVFALLAFSSRALASGSLDDVTKSLLAEPAVQVELKVTPRQRTLGEARFTGKIFRACLEVARAASKSEQPVFKWQYTPTERLLPSDLNAAQRSRARQIALQRQLLNSLLTSDATLALDLTPSQIERLEAIAANRDRAFAKAMPAKRISALQAKYTNMAAKVQDDVSEMSDETMEAMVKMSERLVGDISLLSIEMEVKNRPITLAADGRALRVLTAAQRTRLRSLQGRTFRG
ncbi:MAG: hypothetical protein ACO1SV_16165 [Fimbriimonas sp.]